MVPVTFDQLSMKYASNSYGDGNRSGHTLKVGPGCQVSINCF
jgi:hypothetical protein